MRARAVPFTVAIAAMVLACGARTGLTLEDGAPALGSLPDGGTRDASTNPPRDAGARVDARVDAAVPTPNPICVVPDDPQPGITCRASILFVGPLVKSSDSCFVDAVVVPGDRGEIVYDCNGGLAEAIIGSAIFRGSFDGVRVDACAGTSFPWSDGCDWNSAQRIEGTLASGELHFTYAEAPAPGQAGCLSPCSAAGKVIVE
jgi:hypothetical protein